MPETNERRTSPRYPAELAGELEWDGGTSEVAITQDVSTGGVAVLSLMDVAEGTTVRLHVLVGGVALVVRGNVSRCQPISEQERTIWPTKLVITAHPGELDPVLAALAGR